MTSPAKFPSRDNAEITCGWLYDASTNDRLGPASENQTYLYLQSGAFTDTYAGHPRRVYVKDGRVQDKVSGVSWTC